MESIGASLSEHCKLVIANRFYEASQVGALLEQAGKAGFAMLLCLLVFGVSPLDQIRMLAVCMEGQVEDTALDLKPHQQQQQQQQPV